MNIFVYVDANGYCQGWSSSLGGDGIYCSIEENYSFLNSIAKYRVDTESSKFIYDETNALSTAKEVAKVNLAINNIVKLANEKLMILVDLKPYLFSINEQAVSQLMNYHTMLNSGWYTELDVPCENMDGSTTSVQVTSAKLQSIIKTIIDYQQMLNVLNEVVYETLDKMEDLVSLTKFQKENRLSDDSIEEELPLEVSFSEAVDENTNDFGEALEQEN